MTSKLETAHKKLTDQVMDHSGVAGTAIGERKGEPCLVVYLKEKSAGKNVPKTVDGFRVVREITGEMRAL